MLEVMGKERVLNRFDRMGAQLGTAEAHAGHSASSSD
jgi:hypothetical protein